MSLRIRVYVDYVCPYSYLASYPLEEAIRGKDASVEWMPFELRPAPQLTLRPEDDYVQRTWLLSVYPLAKKMGVPISLPKISPQPHTRLAFEGFHFARENGKSDEYHRRAQRAFFQEGLDIGKVNILARLAGEIGLDEKDFRKALETGRYAEVHRKALYHARVEAGVSSVPTFLMNGRRLVGMQTKETLDRVITRAADESRRRASGEATL